MRGLAGFVGMNVGGALGWWLGSSFGLGASLLLSVAGTAAGLYYGRKWLEDFLNG